MQGFVPCHLSFIHKSHSLQSCTCTYYTPLIINSNIETPVIRCYTVLHETLLAAALAGLPLIAHVPFDVMSLFSKSGTQISAQTAPKTITENIENGTKGNRCGQRMHKAKRDQFVWNTRTVYSMCMSVSHRSLFKPRCSV